MKKIHYLSFILLVFLISNFTTNTYAQTTASAMVYTDSINNFSFSHSGAYMNSTERASQPQHGLQTGDTEANKNSIFYAWDSAGDETNYSDYFSYSIIDPKKMLCVAGGSPVDCVVAQSYFVPAATNIVKYGLQNGKLVKEVFDSSSSSKSSSNTILTPYTTNKNNVPFYKISNDDQGTYFYCAVGETFVCFTTSLYGDLGQQQSQHDLLIMNPVFGSFKFTSSTNPAASITGTKPIQNPTVAIPPSVPVQAIPTQNIKSQPLPAPSQHSVPIELQKKTFLDRVFDFIDKLAFWKN